jgi:hypothetical protein
MTKYLVAALGERDILLMEIETNIDGLADEKNELVRLAVRIRLGLLYACLSILDNDIANELMKLDIEVVLEQISSNLSDERR